MRYRKLGTTGVDVSILGFGCMRLPVIDRQSDRIDYDLATEMLHYAIDNGVNYVDTAYFYHATQMGQRGESEPFVGHALSGGWRERVNLATKMPLGFCRECARHGPPPHRAARAAQDRPPRLLPAPRSERGVAGTG